MPGQGKKNVNVEFSAPTLFSIRFSVRVESVRFQSSLISALIYFLVDYPLITVKEKVFTSNQSFIKSSFNLQRKN